MLTSVGKFTPIALAGIVTVLFVPMQWLPKCPVHALTGLLCPGCGIQRAISALLHGDLKSAFDFNQLMFVAPIFILSGVVAKSRRVKWLETLTIVLAALAMVTFTIIRNL